MLPQCCDDVAVNRRPVCGGDLNSRTNSKTLGQWVLASREREEKDAQNVRSQS